MLKLFLVSAALLFNTAVFAAGDETGGGTPVTSSTAMIAPDETGGGVSAQAGDETGGGISETGVLAYFIGLFE